MVRFCDKEILCIEIEEIERQKLLHFFLNGHLEDIVCVVDNLGRHLGMITYYSLLHSINLNGAILGQQVRLDQHIWKNIRKLLAGFNKDYSELIPVVDEKGELISFAYEDAEANREIRMLRELMEEPNALQFCEVYPEYQCVNVYGFNELAYYFVQYLKFCGISFRVNDVLWEYMDIKEEMEDVLLDYRCLNIFAETTVPKTVNWRENLLRTVSVEFECIDKIYEENIRRGIIKNQVCDEQELINRLVKEKVAILGTDLEAQDAYDYFVREGIEVKCFVVNSKGNHSTRLFGKSILNFRECMIQYGNDIVFIDNHEKNSAWGIGSFGVDYFDYFGYERNKQFYYLKDYVQWEGCGLQNVLKDREVVLAGDYYLCVRLADYLRNVYSCCEWILYLTLPEDKLPEKISVSRISLDNLHENMICLIVIPEYPASPACMNIRQRYTQKRRRIKDILHLQGLCEYSDYFSQMSSFISIEKGGKCKYPHEDFRIKRIILGSINSHSGNMFFRGLLDGHPSILLWDNYSHLNNNLFWFCIRMAGRDVDEIVHAIREIYCDECADEQLQDKKFEKFLEGIRNLLSRGTTYTSQELFIAFHKARQYACEGKMNESKDCVIYWEPHYLDRNVLEMCIQWLDWPEVLPCEVIRIVRNAWISKGSTLKGIKKNNGNFCSSNLAELFYGYALEMNEVLELPEEKGCLIRFEDLKCKPEEKLRYLCARWGISWSDSLLHTTLLGKSVMYNGIKDFDLTPVYNNYEEFFSEFDRFRISLIDALWQKTYGYPYVDLLDFSRKDLQEMFLKDFRFSKEIEFASSESKLTFQIKLQMSIRESLQKLRMISIFTNV